MEFVKAWEKEARGVWQESLTHPFVRGLADGSLEEEKFIYYLLQDHYYLTHFVKVTRLAKMQTRDPKVEFEMDRVLERLRTSELSMREAFYPRAGISDQALTAVQPSPAAYHYTSHLYRMAFSDEFGITMAALLPCYALYADMGNLYLKEKSPHPLYQELLASYAAKEYQAAVFLQKELVEKAAQQASEAVRERMRKGFLISAELEVEFFNMAFQKQVWRGVENETV
ncbi:thiaminase II [Listeria kieliensis]|uniref:Aminopyrimidine aminohydrolase n=1 Tax=Listeria kieliensis TaxID=1621700 RepID=A0A3D8TS62_9LIST|nr:thiaminase II [Listeria kieliensis]RDX01259.1 transcriptional regulator [Listeria kieliensis]